jgi:hypothetical protein
VLKRARTAERSWLLPSVLPVILLLPLLALRHLRVIYTSDSTAQQSIVRTWLDVGHGTTTVPRDTWALKVPIYLVLENLPLSPRDRLLAAVLVLNALTFLMLGWAVWKLAASSTAGVRWYEVAVPLAWLSTLGGGIGSNRMLPNYRNIELGLSFVMLALIAGYLAGQPSTADEAAPGFRRFVVLNRRSIAAGAGCALLLSLLWFDDPYIELLLAAPLVVAALGWFVLRERNRRLLWLVAVLIASFAGTGLLRAIAARAGIAFSYGEHALAVSPSDLALHLSFLLPGTGLQLLGPNSWDAGAADLITRGLVVAVFAVQLVASGRLAWYGWRERRFVVTFLALHWPLVVAGFLVSWDTQNVSAGRYLILGICDLSVATAVLLPELRARHRGLGRALIALLALGAVLNLSTGAATAIDAARRPSLGLPHQQAEVDAIHRAATEFGAVKGYAPFWSANITSYLAGAPVTEAEIVCRNGRLSTRQWLSDTARLTRKAGPVFLLWDPTATYLTGCSAAIRDAQLGAPLARYPLTPTSVPTPGGAVDELLIYGSDIAPRLSPDPS